MVTSGTGHCRCPSQLPGPRRRPDATLRWRQKNCQSRFRFQGGGAKNFCGLAGLPLLRRLFCKFPANVAGDVAGIILELIRHLARHTAALRLLKFVRKRTASGGLIFGGRPLRWFVFALPIFALRRTVG